MNKEQYAMAYNVSVLAWAMYDAGRSELEISDKAVLYCFTAESSNSQAFCASLEDGTSPSAVSSVARAITDAFRVQAE